MELNFPEKSRLKALLDHFAVIEDPRKPWRVAHPLAEILLLVVCGTIADYDDYEAIVEWGRTHLQFLRCLLPYHHGVPGARWLTILMNGIEPGLFADAVYRLGTADLAGSLRSGRHRRQDFAARPRPRRRQGPAPSRFRLRTTSRLILGQEVVADKSNETTAIALLLERLAARGGLQGTLVSIDLAGL